MADAILERKEFKKKIPFCLKYKSNKKRNRIIEYSQDILLNIQFLITNYSHLTNNKYKLLLV